MFAITSNIPAYLQWEPQKEKRERRGRKIFEEIMTKKSPYVARKKKSHSFKGSTNPSKITTKRSIASHCSQTVEIQSQEKILKAARENDSLYAGEHWYD